MIYDYQYSENGFLGLFKDCNEDGDIAFDLDIEDKNISLKEICSSFENCGFGLFCFGNNIPHLKEKIRFEIIKEKDDEFLIMQLAPLLGLPGEDSKTELKELEELLIWLKEKSFAHPNETVRFILDSVGKDACFSLRTKNNELTNELNIEMYELINTSTSLNKWIENQKIGIINNKGKLNDLCASLTGYNLMSETEKREYLKLIKPEKKEKLDRKSLLKRRHN